MKTATVRYPMYWDSRSSKGVDAQQILSSRQGSVVTAESADELFTELLESVEALDTLAEPPLTTAMAVARLKRYLPDPVRRIELHDLVMTKTDHAIEAVANLPLSTQPTAESIDSDLRELHIATTPLLHLLIEGVHHDEDRRHVRLWTDVLQRLLDARHVITGYTANIALQHYPALLALRTISIVAVNRNRDDVMLELLTKPRWTDPTNSSHRPSMAAHALHLHNILDAGVVNSLPRWNDTRWQYPQSHLVRADLESLFGQYLTAANDYRLLCDDVEYRTGLVQHLTTLNDEHRYHLRPNSGEFVGDQNWSTGDPKQPKAEVRFTAQLDATGCWATAAGGVWDPAVVDSYRTILANYRQW